MIGGARSVGMNIKNHEQDTQRPAQKENPLPEK